MKNKHEEDNEVKEVDQPILASFLHTCMNLLRDQKAIEGLQALIDNCVGKEKLHLEQRAVNKVYKNKKRISREMQLNAQIGDYEMNQVILDLGLDANILPKQTWERMGRPKLQWSPIQLRMENQQEIIPMGRLQEIRVDINGAGVLVNFEVIEITDDSNPYPALLGFDWAYDMDVIINLKKRQMIFEKNGTRNVVPLDPLKGVRYTEPI